jgi:hypothetical protein
MANSKIAFKCILNVPPPDCAHCQRPTYLPGTPERFRPENAVGYSGCRRLCSTCYCVLRLDPEALAAYPRIRYRKCLDILEDFEYLQANYGGSKRLVAERLGMKHTTLCQALARARRILAREAAEAAETTRKIITDTEAYAA